MGKDVSKAEKKRSLFWIGLLVLVIMMAAIGWQAKSLFRQSGPAQAPAPVRVKVPPVPPPKPIPINSSPAVEKPDALLTDEKPTSPEGHDDKNSSLAEQTAPESTTPGITPSGKTAAPATATPQSAEKAEPAQESHTDSAPAEKTVAETNQPQPNASTSEKAAATGNQPIPKPAAPESKALSKPTATPEPAPAKPEPPPTKATPEPANQTVASAPYTIQAGAFRTKIYAVQRAALLSEKGYDSYIFEVTDANRKPWYTVRFGQFETRDKAAQALSGFKKKTKMDGIISRSDTL